MLSLSVSVLFFSTLIAKSNSASLFNSHSGASSLDLTRANRDTIAAEGDRSVSSNSNYGMSCSQKYSSILTQLYRINMYNPVKMGLDNTMTLYEHIGKPLDKIKVIHVAGTNGKGSVSLKVAECLRNSGLKTGLFVSPHVSSFRERVQVNGQIMTEEDVTTILPEVFDMCRHMDIPATFFEITTIMSFLKFKRSQCDAVVLEVGLGGRLDATNVVSPTLSIITSIQLDHTKILGDTIEKIAMEKAGIMKRGVDVLVGPGCPVELLRTEAAKVGAPFHTISDLLRADERLYHAPVGEELADIDDLNTDIARAALRLLRQKVGGTDNSTFAKAILSPTLEGRLSARPPCRFEVFSKGGVTVVLDIAHNEDAIIALVKKVQFKYPNRRARVVIGMSSDKTVDKCIASMWGFLKSPDRFYCVEARHPRALPHTELRSLITQVSKQQPAQGNDGDIRSSLRKAILAAAPEDDVVLVCGTAFIMAEARAEIGIVEPKDGDILSETGNTDLADLQDNFAPSK